MKHVSVTEILAWRHCRQLWDYRYRRRLKSQDVPPQLASGTSVHSTIQAVLGGSVKREDMGAWAESSFREQVLQRTDLDADVKKYLPGVQRALSKVPEWVWEGQWHVEEKLTHIFPVGVAKQSEDLLEVVGVPDLYSYNDGLLTIVEFKTTDTDPLEFLLWNPQHRYYAALLSYVYPGAVTVFRYVCLPTGKSVDMVDHMPYTLTKAALRQAEEEMLRGAVEVGEGDTVPNYSRACSFCEYKDIDTIRVQGGDYEEAIKEGFVRRPHHD